MDILFIIIYLKLRIVHKKEIDEYKTYLNIIGFKYYKTIDDDEEKSDVYINNDNVMVLIGYSNKNNEDYKKNVR